MSLVNENGGMVMPVGPMYGNGNGGSFGFGGDGSFWIIILFLFAMFGNGWGGWNNGGNGGGVIQIDNGMQRGFDQQAIMNSLSGINSSLSAAEVSRCNTQANILQTLNQNQSAANQAMNSLAMSLQNCCCENRAGLADLKYTVATEACSDRQAVTNALFDVTTANNANTQQLMNTINNGIQAIQDKLCQQEIEALKTQNQNLQTQLNMANLAASQGNQTATIQAGQRALANEIEQYVLPTPRPAYVVQNPNCCAQNNFGCGCGCGMA